jgi:hypothetical protein
VHVPDDDRRALEHVAPARADHRGPREQRRYLGTAVAHAHTASLIHPLMTARRCREDMIERSDSAERIEPKLAKEPMENADPKDPMEPMDRNEPTLPIDKTEFLDPIDRIDPSDRIEHQQPCLVTARVYGS